MRATEAAYIAGILDGEGCLSLSLRKEIYVTPTVQVTNTDRAFIDWLHGQIGGGSVYEMRERRPTRKPVYMWRCAGAVARELVREARPYLRIKARQADVILGLVSEYEVRADVLGRPQRRRLTAGSIDRNREAIVAIRKLNRRGRGAEALA